MVRRIVREIARTDILRPMLVMLAAFVMTYFGIQGIAIAIGYR